MEPSRYHHLNFFFRALLRAGALAALCLPAGGEFSLFLACPSLTALVMRKKSVTGTLLVPSLARLDSTIGRLGACCFNELSRLLRGGSIAIVTPRAMGFVLHWFFLFS